MSVHWAADENRLLMDTPTMDREIRVYHRHTGWADRRRDAAYRSGKCRRPWEKGDPSRGGKPWPAFCREFYEWGLEEAEEVERTRRADQAQQIAERQLRAAAKALAKRRKRRDQRRRKFAELVAPNATRKWRRWQRRRHTRRS